MSPSDPLASPDEMIQSLDIYDFPDEPPVFRMSFGKATEESGILIRPGSVALSPQGDLYVMDGERQEILKYTASGQLIKSMPTNLRVESYASIPSGNLVVIYRDMQLGYFINAYNQDLKLLKSQFVGYSSIPYDSIRFHIVDTDRIYVAASTYDNGTQCYIQRMNDQGQVNHQFRVLECDNTINLYLTTDHQGNIFVSHRKGDEYLISKYTSSGILVNSYSMGSNWTYLLNADPSGNIYCVKNSKIQSVLIFNNDLTTFTETSLGGRITENTGNISFTPEGNFYLNTEFQVRKFDSELNLLYILGVVDGEMVNPIDAAGDSKGNIYVVDSAQHRVQKFDSYGQYLFSFGELGLAPGMLRHPRAIAVDGNDDIYVATSNGVQKFDQNGNHLLSLFSGTITDVAVDRSGNIYSIFKDGSSFCWPGNGCNGETLNVSNPAGQTLRTWSMSGDVDLTALAVDSNNFVYVGIYKQLLSSSKHLLLKLDPELNLVKDLYEPFIEDNRHRPVVYGLDVDNYDNVYAAAEQNLILFDSDGNPYAGINNSDQSKPFTIPSGVAVNSQGFIYICDSGNKKIHKYEPNITPIDIDLTNTSVKEGLPVNTPIGALIAIDPNIGDSHTFSLITGEGGLDNSLFNIARNSLRTNAVLNYNLQPNYRIRIRATDQGGRVFEKPFNITIYTDTLAPELDQITPGYGYADLTNQINLLGWSFVDGAMIRLGSTNQQSLSMRFLDPTSLLALVPSALPIGKYDVWVTNPNGLSDSIAQAYEILDPAGNDLYANWNNLWTIPNQLIKDQPASIGLTVNRVGGLTDLTNVKVIFYIGDPNTGGEPLAETLIAKISPGGSASTPPIAWTPSTSGRYTLFAVIDPDHHIAETLETNNSISRSISVKSDFVTDANPPVVTAFSLNNGEEITASRDLILNTTALDGEGQVESLMFLEYYFNKYAGQWVSVYNTGWMPYDQVRQDYPYTLHTPPGLVYLQAWAVDQAGNISNGPLDASINFVPPFDVLQPGQNLIYRYTLLAGQQLKVQVTALEGDPDLYVWAPDYNTRLPWFSNYRGLLDQVSFQAPIDGVYQVEVKAYAPAQYWLNVEISDSVSAEAVTAQNISVSPLSSSGGIDPGKDTPDEPIVDPNHNPDSKIAVTQLPNTAPLLLNTNAVCKINTPLNITPQEMVTLFIDTDIHDAIQFLQFTSLPQHGTLFLNGEPVLESHQDIQPDDILELIYLPNTDYFGQDTFTWNATDGKEYAMLDSTYRLSIQKPFVWFPTVSGK